MNKKDKFIKLMEKFKESSLLKYIGDQEIPGGKKYKMFNARKNHGDLKKNSTYVDTFLKRKNYIPDENNNLFNNLSVEDISDFHNISYNYVVEQIIKGKEIELDYMDDPEMAKKIAMNHLIENPYYYEEM